VSVLHAEADGAVVHTAGGDEASSAPERDVAEDSGTDPFVAVAPVAASGVPTEQVHPYRHHWEDRSMHAILITALLLVAPLQAPAPTPPAEALAQTLLGINSLIAERGTLTLTSTQRRALRALHAEVRHDLARLSNSSKPLVTHLLVLTAAEVRRRTLSLREPAQPPHAVTLLDASMQLASDD